MFGRIEALHSAATGHRRQKRRQFPAGVNGLYTGQGQSGTRIDGLYGGMRIGAAQNIQVQHVVELDVVNIAAVAGEQPRILTALDALSDQGFGLR